MKKINLVILFALLLVVLAGCGSTGDTDVGNSDEKITVHIADFKSYPASSQIIIAEKLGFFENEFAEVNAEADITKFLNGPAINEAFAAGSIDFCAMGVLPAISGIHNTKGQEIIGLNIENFGEGILVYPDSGVETVEDLKGKKIGYAVGTNDQIILQEILGDYGLSLDDFDSVNLAEDADRQNGLISRTVDAIVAYEPFISSIQKANDVTLVTDNREHPMLIVLLGRTGFSEEHPEITVAFLKAIQDANEWIADNLEEAITIVQAETGVEEESIRATFAKIENKLALSESNIAELDNVTDYLKETGVITEDFHIGDYANTSYYEEFLE